jgi:hypothetical protein
MAKAASTTGLSGDFNISTLRILGIDNGKSMTIIWLYTFSQSSFLPLLREYPNSHTDVVQVQARDPSASHKWVASINMRHGWASQQMPAWSGLGRYGYFEAAQRLAYNPSALRWNLWITDQRSTLPKTLGCKWYLVGVPFSRVAYIFVY